MTCCHQAFGRAARPWSVAANWRWTLLQRPKDYDDDTACIRSLLGGLKTRRLGYLQWNASCSCANETNGDRVEAMLRCEGKCVRDTCLDDTRGRPPQEVEGCYVNDGAKRESPGTGQPGFPRPKHSEPGQLAERCAATATFYRARYSLRQK